MRLSYRLDFKAWPPQTLLVIAWRLTQQSASLDRIPRQVLGFRRVNRPLTAGRSAQMEALVMLIAFISW